MIKPEFNKVSVISTFGTDGKSRNIPTINERIRIKKVNIQLQNPLKQQQITLLFDLVFCIKVGKSGGFTFYGGLVARSTILFNEKSMKSPKL
jgi:hypothetical protein